MSLYAAVVAIYSVSFAVADFVVIYTTVAIAHMAVAVATVA